MAVKIIPHVIGHFSVKCMAHRHLGGASWFCTKNTDVEIESRRTHTELKNSLARSGWLFLMRVQDNICSYCLHASVSRNRTHAGSLDFKIKKYYKLYVECTHCTTKRSMGKFVNKTAVKHLFYSMRNYRCSSCLKRWKSPEPKVPVDWSRKSASDVFSPVEDHNFSIDPSVVSPATYASSYQAVREEYDRSVRGEWARDSQQMVQMRERSQRLAEGQTEAFRRQMESGRAIPPSFPPLYSSQPVSTTTTAEPRRDSTWRSLEDLAVVDDYSDE